MAFISAVIITFNEADTIARCVESLLPVADEVIVVDSFSTDDTFALCQSLPVRVVQCTWQGYAAAKNYGNSLAKHDYILSIDADEVLSPELQQSILNSKEGLEGAAYCLSRLTNYCGHWVRHCGWYPDAKVRLWDKRSGQWEGIIHEKIILPESVKIQKLAGDLLHYSFPTIKSHIETLNKFSEVAAEAEFAKGKKIVYVYHLLLNPLFTFFSKYFLKLGFLDGHYGFVICFNSAFANFIKYAKIRALNKP